MKIVEDTRDADIENISKEIRDFAVTRIKPLDPKKLYIFILPTVKESDE